MISTQERDETPTDDSEMRLRVSVLKALMRAKEIKSVAELARKSGVSKATIFRLMAGQPGSRRDTAMSLARTLGTTVETLFPAPAAGE